jgi:hypothetical protein
MAKTKKTDTAPTDENNRGVITSMDVELDNILCSITTTVYNDFNRIGKCISDEKYLDSRAIQNEQTKMQYGTLAVKAILARIALKYSRRF